MAYEDSRLVALYDIDNPDGPDHDFYRSLANETGASSILDLDVDEVVASVYPEWMSLAPGVTREDLTDRVTAIMATDGSHGRDLQPGS